MNALKLPYFAAAVKAGFPSPAQDYIEDRIDLNDLFIKHPHSTFINEFENEKDNSFKSRKRNGTFIILLLILVWVMVRAWRNIAHY